MSVKQLRSLQFGSALESLIAVPLVLFACLLVLQMMLLYRAKISLNFATQEAARIGAMSNGRVVPRFLTDITQFSAVMRTKNKCLARNNVVVPTQTDGTCPAGSAAEAVAPDGPPTDAQMAAAGGGDGEDDEGESKQDDRNNMRQQQSEAAVPGASTTASAPAARPTASAASAARTSKEPGAGAKFLASLGRGMMRYGDSSVLQGFIIGIAPLYTKGTSFNDAAQGQIRAYGDAMMNSCIMYHNPTHSAFLDFGFVEADGPDRLAWQIPNDLLRYRIPGQLDPVGKGIGYYKSKGKYLSEEEPGLRGKHSDMSVQDATLLSIEIKYSYKLEVPIARDILIGLAKLTGGLSDSGTAIGNAFNAASLKNGRWPLASFATYRMQTPVHWHMFYPFGNISNVKTSNVEAFDLVQELYKKIEAKVNNKFDPSEPQAGFCPGLLFDQVPDIGTRLPGTDYSNESGGGNAEEDGAIRWIGKDYDKKSVKP